MLCPSCQQDVIPNTAGACPICGSPVSAVTQTSVTYALPAGTKLQGGAFSIGKVLGQGGFAITYQGSDQRLKRPVAIKEFFPEGCVRQGNVVLPSGSMTIADYHSLKAKFLDEARTLAKFQHPSIAQVYASFEEHNTGYMVMEFVPGKDLLRLLVDRGCPLSEVEAIDYIEKAGEALEVVHKAQVLHRDIKPQNILASPNGRVVLIDFGTARHFVLGQTSGHTAMLTPGYAAPEQYPTTKGESKIYRRVGPYTDIYALGATLYHLLTASIPEDANQRAFAILNSNPDPLVPPHRLPGRVSQGVSDAVMWAMEIVTKNRPQSVPEFLGALRGQVVRKPSGPVGPAARTSFKFKSGEAFSVADLIDLCDRFWDEAEDYLFNGYIEQWITGNLGEAGLAQQARTIAQGYRREQRKGLELFVRELCKRAGIDPYPKLICQPGSVDLGKLPVGAQTSTVIRLRNTGRGQAWGTVTIAPPLPGLSVQSKFDSSNATVDIRADVLNVPPGSYKGNLVIQADGVPQACSVPLRYEVVPLAVEFRPVSLDLGAIPYGKETTASLRIESRPPGGRLTGGISFDPPCEGLKVTGVLDGPFADVEIALDTKRLTAGRAYRTELSISSNAGTFKVPIAFRVGTSWSAVARWTVGLSISAGIAMWLTRYLLAESAPLLRRWFLTYVESKDVLVACGVFGGIVLGVLVLIIASIRSAKRARA